MSGSQKGRKLRPYRTGPVTPLHVLLLTPDEIAADERERAPTTRDMLDWTIEPSAPVETTTP